MSNEFTETEAQKALRPRALQRLKDPEGVLNSRLDAASALGVLYELASSPSTASAALALLHELQVNQVELELQAEELRRTRAELEAAAKRQTQIYDYSPVGCVTLDNGVVMREINLTAASMLGGRPDELLGRGLDSFLAPQSQRVLREMLDRVRIRGGTEPGALQLIAAEKPRCVHAAASLDPNGGGFLVALIDVAADAKAG